MTSDAGTPSRLGETPPIAKVRAGRTVPIALLLFPAASVLGYMSRNLAETAVIDVLPALAGATACAVVVWLIVVALRGRADAGAAVIAALWVVAGLYYIALFGAINSWIGGDYTRTATLPIALVGLAAATFAVHRLRTLDAPIHIVLSAIAVVMLATPLARLPPSSGETAPPDRSTIRTPRSRNSPNSPGRRSAQPAAPTSTTSCSTDTARRRPWRTTYGVEATIGGYLEERGFFVAADSHSNYLKTGQSLASTFHLDYIDLLSDPRISGTSWHPVFAMLDDHRVARLLKGFGYDFLQFGSWWKGTHRNALADENHPYGFNEFTMYYLRQTVLRTATGLFPRSQFAMQLDWDNGQCQRVARQVEQLKAIGARETPVYVFAHFLLPHDPFVFGPDGRCLPLDEANARGGFQGYIDQVAYADRIIEDLVEALQSHDQSACHSDPGR